MKRILALSSFLVFAVPCLYAQAPTFGTYGDTTVVPGPGGTPVYQLTSDTSMAGYAGIYVQFNSPLAVSDLGTLSADFVMTQNTIGNGAPRFSIGDTTSNPANEAYVFFGTPAGGGSFTDPTPGSWESTGNIVDSTDLIVQNNGFGGGSTGASYETWAQFVAQEGGTDIGFITIDVDGGFSGTQTADVNNFDVNGTLYTAAAAPTPEPSSLLLFATALLAAAGLMWQRSRVAHS